MNRFLLGAILLFLLTGCHAEESMPADVESNQIATNKETRPAEKELEASEMKEAERLDYETLKAATIEKYEGAVPETWGENVEGVITHINTDEKKIALTFDACIGTPDAYDADLMQFLIEEEIPATLFLGGHWIEAYEEEFLALVDTPLFEIANHGYDHKPLSVNGNSAYGIEGTQNVAEVFDEIYYNQQHIKDLTGEYPKYFRSGTAFYDEVAVKIANDLGLTVVNYNRLGDAGVTFNQTQIADMLKAAEPGSIYLFHMNHSESDVAEGVKEGILALKEQGYEFVQLQGVDELLQ